MSFGGPRDLAGLAALPASVGALVFDLDGVLIDSVAADLALCRQAAREVIGNGDWVERSQVLAHFALHPPAFWDKLCEAAPFPVPAAARRDLVAAYDRLRASAEFELIPGAVDLMQAARAAGLPVAVASSNDVDVVAAILCRTGLERQVSAVAGITPAIAGKPAPDIYLDAARQLGLPPAECACAEDSLTGLRAGRAAGYGHIIAVATGAEAFEDLAAAGLADVCHTRFARPGVVFHDGRPTQKSIVTPNDFVSHMVEHIAWRLGTGIELAWHSTDWRGLGAWLGGELRSLGLRQASAASLGMIDDGAAECLVDLDAAPHFVFSTHASLDPEKVLDMRVEQVGRGADLAQLLEGLAAGLAGRIEMRLCTFEDPHHSWEGVYRALGITLSRLRAAA
ncbi:MAG: HAD family phosphatase [Pseudomonadota bacterium]